MHIQNWTHWLKTFLFHIFVVSMEYSFGLEFYHDTPPVVHPLLCSHLKYMTTQIDKKNVPNFCYCSKFIVDYSFFLSMPIVKLEVSKEKFETDQGHDSSVKRFATSCQAP